MEAKSCSTSLLALLTAELPLQSSQFTCNPIVISTFKIWSQFRYTFGLQGLSNHSPIHNNHLFLPPSTDTAFSLWQSSGLVRLRDLYTNNVFASFSELSKKFHLPKSHLFRYFQVRNFVKLNSTAFPNTPPNSVIDSILDTPINQKGLISKIYTLISHLDETSIDKIRKNWEEEFGRVIADSDWDSALARVNNSTSCSRLNLIQFKVVHRIYFTNSKLSKIYSNIADTCNRCHMTPADMTHMFWSCPRLHDYWTNIFKHLAQALNMQLTPCAELAIFGVLPDSQMIRRKTKDSIAFASLLARRRILLEWKSPFGPKASLWLKDLMLYLDLEKIKYNLRGTPGKFDSVWGCMISYVAKLKTLQNQ